MVRDYVDAFSDRSRTEVFCHASIFATPVSLSGCVFDD